MEQRHVVKADVLRDFCTEVFARLGVPERDAAIIADSLVDADLRGVESHGVFRVDSYAGRLREGTANPRPNIKVIKENPSTLLLDADMAIGNVVGVLGMERAIEKAKKTSIAVVSIRNSTPNGTLAHSTMMAMEHGMIGFMTTSTPPLAPPYGGKTTMLGTNPWCFAVPAGEEYPIVLDMSTTASARGRIRLAAQKGTKIPLDWAIDETGIPTDDPNKALLGFLQWMGGPKGYGLGIISSVLGGALSGGLFTPDFPPTPPPTEGQVTHPTIDGHFIMALNIESFLPLAEFTGRIDRLIRYVKSSEPIKKGDEIRLPGERGLKLRDERLKSGVPVTPSVWTQLVKLQKDLHIKINLERNG